MEPDREQQKQPHEPTADEIDDKYSDVDPEDIVEDSIDYFRGEPRTESEKAAESEQSTGTGTSS